MHQGNFSPENRTRLNRSKLVQFLTQRQLEKSNKYSLLTSLYKHFNFRHSLYELNTTIYIDLRVTGTAGGELIFPDSNIVLSSYTKLIRTIIIFNLNQSFWKETKYYVATHYIVVISDCFGTLCCMFYLTGIIIKILKLTVAYRLWF